MNTKFFKRIISQYNNNIFQKIKRKILSFSWKKNFCSNSIQTNNKKEILKEKYINHIIDTSKTFNDLGINNIFVNQLKEKQWIHPTNIQVIFFFFKN